MRRFGMLMALMTMTLGIFFFCAHADESSGVAGAFIINLLVKGSHGLLDSAAATSVYGVIAIIIVRILQTLVSRIPTRRRTIVGRIIWRVAEILFGKEVALKNNLQSVEDPRERERIKAELKKRFPILDLKVRGE